MNTKKQMNTTKYNSNPQMVSQYELLSSAYEKMSKTAGDP